MVRAPTLCQAVGAGLVSVRAMASVLLAVNLILSDIFLNYQFFNWSLSRVESTSSGTGGLGLCCQASRLKDWCSGVLLWGVAALLSSLATLGRTWRFLKKQ